MGTQLHPPKGAQQPSPFFRPMSIVVKRLDGSGCYLVRTTEVGVGPSDIVLDGDTALPTQRGTAALPSFFRSCLLWPNGLDGSAYHLIWR